MNARVNIAVCKRDCLLTFAVIASVMMGALMVDVPALQAATLPRVQLSISQAGPRAVEEQTKNAILRDYTAAWKSYSAALAANDPDALGDVWVGFARRNCLDAIQAQQHSGVRVRYLDDQHKLDAVFYSQEGSALELHDTAQLQRQVLDGNSVIATENLTAHYVVIMTPASDHWQVRIMQSVPNF